jgi:hypothetical protein
MADPQDQPERGATGIPPAPRKAQAKKAPAKKAPAKKAPAKKAPAKKAPAKKATPRPALAASPAATPLTDGDSAARQAAADAKASVQKADHPAALRSSPESDYRLPISLGLAAAGLVALVLSRLRRG